MAEYDYIIIGAGPAGLVLASRLSQNPNHRILLIEAGANRIGDPNIDTLGLLGQLYGKEEYDWDYLSVPQVNANNRQLGQPRGKVLGGSTAINFGVVVYPTREDFDAWTALGNKGWGAEEMGPYLRKFHTYTSPSEATATLVGLDGYTRVENQGSSGPIPVTLPDHFNEFNTAFSETLGELGWKDDGRDPIDGEKMGAFATLLALDGKSGKRGYAAAYYEGIAERENLTLLTETMVERIFLSDSEEGVVATGVQVKRKDGSTEQYQAAKEVIVSAGTLNTPQLLELSGIGKADILDRYNIPVILNLPVGENLQDHCMSIVSAEVADGRISGDMARDPKVVEAMLKLYAETRSGPLSGSALTMAYLPLVDHNGVVSKDDIQQLLSAHPPTTEQEQLVHDMILNSTTAQYSMFPVQMNTNTTIVPMSEAFASRYPENYVSMLITLNHPLSRGSVHIQSSKIDDKPLYDPNYLSHPLDLEILGRHTQFFDRIVATPPFAGLLSPSNKRIPRHASDLSNLQSAKDVVKETLYSTMHPVGTCSMMPKEKGGVVDSQLRVHGTKNLRVVDASVFPLEMTGNIQSSVYAVAEKAADLILNELS